VGVRRERGLVVDGTAPQGVAMVRGQEDAESDDATRPGLVLGTRTSWE
jgi:hypothetical protein